MNLDEYHKWREDAFNSLIATKYTVEEANIILKWFDSIKGSDERDLVGEEFLNNFCNNYPKSGWNLYNSLMSRIWIYAPLILQENKNDF